MRKNPFVFAKSGDCSLFVDREEEKRKIIDYIENKQNVIVIGPRKIGKTWLFSKVREELEGRDYKGVWLDVSRVTTVKDLAKMALNEMFSVNWHTLSSLGPGKILQRIPEKIRQKVSIQISLGFLSLSIEGDNKTAEEIFLDTLQYADSAGKTFIVFDEFQDIAPFNLTGAIRYIAQHSKNTAFVFMGSNQSMMRDIFLNKSNIMYYIGTPIFLKRLSNDNIYKLFRKGFAEVRIEPKTAEVMHKIVEMVNGFPYFAQLLGYEIVSNIAPGEKITEEALSGTIDIILEKNSFMYERLLSNRSLKAYKKILHYIAENGSSKGIFAEQLNESLGTIQYTLKKMEEEEILISEDGVFVISDPFFRIYIKKVLL